MRTSISDAGRDLVLGSACVGCGRAGRVLCAGCRAALPQRGSAAWPTPPPEGLALPYAAGAYDGLLKALVIEHKEHGVFALAAPLGIVMSAVVVDLLDALDAGASPGRAVRLVPVPSRRAVVRRRGHDPLLRVARHAAVLLRRRGVEATVGRLLLPAGRVRDQAGLGAADRARNLAGSMGAVAGRARPGRGGGGLTLVVDDVITTGSTAREAQRALESVGITVAGTAAVAATSRRLPAAPADQDVGGSLPLSGRGG